MSLLSLPLTRVTGKRDVPQVPSNEQRVQAWLQFRPVQFSNAELLGRIRAAEYAREASPGTDYDTELRDGFALKYGE